MRIPKKFIKELKIYDTLELALLKDKITIELLKRKKEKC